MAFPDSRLAHLDITAAKTAVTDRKKTVLNSTGGGGNERVPSNECVTDAMLDGLLAELLKSTPASEVRPRVVRSPISSRGTPRTQVVRSPILPLRALPPPGSPHAHPNPLTSPPPPSTTRTTRRTLTVASSPPNATLGTPFVTLSGTDPVAVATVPEAVAGLAPVDAEQEDDEPGVQCESEADAISYCKYGRKYRKNTVILENWFDLKLYPECAGSTLCKHKRIHGHHAEHCKFDGAARSENKIHPRLLVQSIDAQIESFYEKCFALSCRVKG
ncbi:unnamed protein product [Bathycoccus prasinos]